MHSCFLSVVERKKTLEEATTEGVKFKTSVGDTLAWLVNTRHHVDGLEPVSAAKDRLVKQSREQEVSRSHSFSVENVNVPCHF